MIKELIVKNRSCRRFFQDVPVSESTLRDLVDLARCSASAANKQPLKYYLSCDPQLNAQIFPQLAWAGYLRDWGGPQEGERPAAYIVILGDRKITNNFNCDHGIAAQSILLGAREQGLGGCIIGSVQRQELARLLGLGSEFEILLVLALGKPNETAVIDPVGPDGDIRYWREPDGTHHVPKRSLDEIILN